MIDTAKRLTRVAPCGTTPASAVWRFARPRKPAGDESARRWPSCCARSRLTKLCGGYIFRQQALLRSVNLDKVIGCRETHSYACRFRQTSLAPTWLTSSLVLGLRPRNAPKCRLAGHEKAPYALHENHELQLRAFANHSPPSGSSLIFDYGLSSSTVLRGLCLNASS